VRPDDGRRAYWRLRHQHPTCGYRERTNDWTSTRKLSDFVSLREFLEQIYERLGVHTRTAAAGVARRSRPGSC
jgi:hypothetical protein